MAEFKTTYHPINHKKCPLVKQWIDYDGKQEGNYARALSRNDLVVDVDIKHPKGMASYTLLQAEGLLPDTKIVTTAHGGYHYHYTKPIDVNIRLNHPTYPGIEFRSYGQACVGEGSVINDVEYKSNGKDPIEAPSALLEKIKSSRQVDIKNLPITDLVPLDDLKILMTYIPDSYFDDYHQWLNIGMCLHQATGGAVAGLQLWDDSSQGMRKYVVGACAEKWKTFRGSREGAISTVASLYKIAYENGFNEKIGDILEALPADKVVDLKSKIELIEELGDWIFVSGNKKFYNLVDGRQFDPDQIKLYYSMVWESKVLQRLVSTIGHADYLRYIPGSAPTLLEGKFKCINTWRPSSIVPAPGNHQCYEEHLKYLFPTDWEHVRNWCAWVVQHPAQRNNWAILLTGGAGVGKTYIATVLQQILGKDNWKSPSNAGLHERFNLWCANSQLVVVNEVMGENRRDLTNALKTLITEDIVPMREMRENEKFIPVYLNLILISNYATALLLDDDDRRFGVFHTHALQQKRAYYENLLNPDKSIKNIEAIYHYLLNVDLKSYDHRHAPKTDSKARLLEEGQSDNFDMHLEEFLVNKKFDIFSLSQVNDYLQKVTQYNHTELVTPQRIAFLLRTKCAFLKRVRVRGTLERLYCVKDKVEYFAKLGNSVLINFWETHTGLGARVEFRPLPQKDVQELRVVN